MYDLIIIGAGPAGSTLARELSRARADMRILMIDGMPKGGSKVCGGLLSPDAQAVLRRQGIALPDEILVSPQAASVDTIDLEARIRRRYSRDYINMDRAKFDGFLLSLTEDAVELVSGRCVDVKRCDGGFEVRVNIGGEYKKFGSRLIVGADGASSILRSSLYPERKIYRYVSVQEWYADQEKNLPDYSCIYDEKTSDSCSWTIRKDGSYVFGGAFPKKGCRDAFSAQKSRLEDFLGVRLGEPVKREACLVCSPRGAGEIFVGDGGAYLVGEAAGFISASSFEGISSALTSGAALAEAIAEADGIEEITALYKRKTGKLRLKILTKIPKMKILCTPALRKLIMKSGVTAEKIY
jgi:flavin-dependent dehydrogenase